MATKLRLAAVTSALALALAGAAVAGCAGGVATEKAEAPVATGAVTGTFVVRGMHCPACEERVRNALHRVDGIFKVDVKLADHRVVIRFDKAKVSPETIVDVIAAAGFQAAAEV